MDEQDDGPSVGSWLFARLLGAAGGEGMYALPAGVPYSHGFALGVLAVVITETLDLLMGLWRGRPAL